MLIKRNSVSLNCLNYFMLYLTYYNIDHYLNNFRFQIYPIWYRSFLMNDNLNINGEIDYANGDRKFSGLLFWRYEKTYSSFICFNCYFENELKYIMLFLHFISEKFYGSHFTEEQIEEINNICTMIFKTYIFSAVDAHVFLINEDHPLQITLFFYDNVKYEEANTKSHSILIHHMKYYESIAHVDIPLKFGDVNINDYIDRLKVASFFGRCDYIILNSLLNKYWNWINHFFIEINEVIEKEGNIALNRNLFLNENGYEVGINIYENKYLSGSKLQQLCESFCEEYLEIFNKQPQKFVNLNKVLEMFIKISAK